MDATAFALCRDQQFDLKVFSIFKQGALKRVVPGEDEGTRTLLSLSPDGAYAVSLNRRGGACCPPAPCEPRQTGLTTMIQDVKNKPKARCKNPGRLQGRPDQRCAPAAPTPACSIT